MTHVPVTLTNAKGGSNKEHAGYLAWAARQQAGGNGVLLVSEADGMFTSSKGQRVTSLGRVYSGSGSHGAVETAVVILGDLIHVTAHRTVQISANVNDQHPGAESHEWGPWHDRHIQIVETTINGVKVAFISGHPDADVWSHGALTTTAGAREWVKGQLATAREIDALKARGFLVVYGGDLNVAGTSAPPALMAHRLGLQVATVDLMWGLTSPELKTTHGVQDRAPGADHKHQLVLNLNIPKPAPHPHGGPVTYPPPNPIYLGPAAHVMHDGAGKPLPNKPIKRIVMHSTVSACAPGGARSIAAYFRSQKAGGSAHYVVDPAEIVQVVYDSVQAEHAPPNANSLGVEMCDMPDPKSAARWGDANHKAMLDRAAELVAQLCLAYNVRPYFVGTIGLRLGRGGVTTHAMVSQTWHQSTHWDPGAWPRQEFMRAVRLHYRTLKKG